MVTSNSFESEVGGRILTIDTGKLAPGRYTLLAVLPNYEQRAVPDLTGEFEVLPR